MPKPKKPTVSVAIATYNGEKFFFEQLESIRNQTLLPHEIVISDDNSSDNTLAIIDQALPEKWRKDHGVALKVLRNAEALGPGKNFEQAILACTSDFIACADQDDVWLGEKLEKLVEALQIDSNLLLIHSDATLVDSAGRPTGMSLIETFELDRDDHRRLESGPTFHAFGKRNLAAGATMLFRRELVHLAFPLPKNRLHDERLALVASYLDGLKFIPDPLINYRQHEANQIGARPRNFADSIFAVLSSRAKIVTSLKSRNEEFLELATHYGTRSTFANRNLLSGFIAHNTWRIGLPKSRLFRVWPVLWGVLQGRYARFGRQPHDVLRDLLMPPHELLLGFYRRLSTRKH